MMAGRDGITVDGQGEMLPTSLIPCEQAKGMHTLSCLLALPVVLSLWGHGGKGDSDRNLCCRHP